jgi:hypothetical protein
MTDVNICGNHSENKNTLIQKALHIPMRLILIRLLEAANRRIDVEMPIKLSVE